MDGEDQKAKVQQGAKEEEGLVDTGGDAGGDGVVVGEDKTGEKGKEDAPDKDYEAAIAKRDERIKELEAQIAEAAKTAEASEKLTREIGELRAQSESDRLDYELKLAGCRSVRAGKAMLGEHDGDIEALKKAEPWLFGAKGANGQTGSTGLPPAGAATSDEKELKRWRKIAGLEEEK